MRGVGSRGARRRSLSYRRSPVPREEAWRWRLEAVKEPRWCWGVSAWGWRDAREAWWG